MNVQQKIEDLCGSVRDVAQTGNANALLLGMLLTELSINSPEIVNSIRAKLITIQVTDQSEKARSLATAVIQLLPPLRSRA